MIVAMPRVLFKQLLKALSFCFFLTISFTAFSAIRLPNIIGSNMVLQQKSETAIWGWSNPSEKIYITTSWNNQKDSVVADGNAKWKLNLKTPEAGGPYTITLKGENSIVLDNIMIGEVWVCSGQSNMEWSSLQKLQQIIDEMPNSQNNNIRLFHVAKTTSPYPQDYVEGSWKVSGPDALKGFSAVAYFFAKELQQKLNVPVAVINTSWGGTPAETWTPAEKVNSSDVLAKSAAMQKTVPWWPVTPGYAYNSMIYPLLNLSIAGAIWYQGEGNTVMPFTYGQLFAEMIQSWRAAWKKDFPFYYVQIAPFNYGNNNVGNLIREQQAKVLNLPKTGMVVISDLVNDVKNIHPTNKKDVALRLANYALAETYGKSLTSYKSPMFKRMDITGNKVNLYFDNAANGFKLNAGKAATEFYLAGPDKVFVPAVIKIEKDRLVASSPEVKNPVAVRFSFSNGGMSNIFSKEGLPVAPFRTDDWVVDTSKVK
ncbi:sialate O-acetylesterase [Niabella hibiscisoli]|uniref:sialate O-acetylesterase n=1 Tax=Niabella hibiscisoli TaxID=1825928 RepID=UPI001F0F1FA6|nr:sialate O-acetylesterase [Niabella hibiscisoli]MCH5715042.1 sialate O-acetylesterase [Niabella hibiscisoli]